MSNISITPSNMYYNSKTGDIREIIPFVGGNGIATAVIPDGYKRLSRLIAINSFRTISGVNINKGTEGAYVTALITKPDGSIDEYTKGFLSIEEIFTDQTKSWADSNCKILGNIRFSGDVMLSSSNFKGSFVILGDTNIVGSNFTLSGDSSINFRKYRTISSSTIEGNVKMAGDITLTNATILTNNHILRTSSNLTIKSSRIELNDDLTILSDFTLTSNNNVALGGLIEGTLRIDTESNECTVSLNVNIESESSVILGRRVNCNGRITSEKTSTVTLANDVILNGEISATRATVTLKKCSLTGNIYSYYDSTVNIDSTGSIRSYVGTIKTLNSSTFTSVSVGKDNTVLSGSITCHGEVELQNNANISGTHEVHNLQILNNGSLGGNLYSNEVQTNVVIKDESSMSGHNVIKCDLTLEDRAKILENASTRIETDNLLVLGDDVMISGNCTIKGNPTIINNAQIKSCVLIDGTPTIKDNAIVSNIYCIDGNALIEGNCTVGGDLYLTGDVAIGGDMYVVIQGPVDGDINKSRYDVNSVYNYGKFYFNWRVTSPYQMSLVITPLKEPIYFYLKSPKHTECFIKLPDRETIISLASLSTELNMTVAYIADMKYNGSTNEDLKEEIGVLRRKTQYYHLASTFMYYFCKTQNFDTTANVLELEPLTLFKC